MRTAVEGDLGVAASNVLVDDDAAMDDRCRCCRVEKLVGAMKADAELKRRASRGIEVELIMGVMIVLFLLLRVGREAVVW